MVCEGVLILSKGKATYEETLPAIQSQTMVTLTWFIFSPVLVKVQHWVNWKPSLQELVHMGMCWKS